MKLHPETQYVIQSLERAGFSAHVLVDGQGRPVISCGWSKDLVISKIDLAKK